MIVVVVGRQPFEGSGLLLPNCRLPLELTFALAKLWSYKAKLKGRAIEVVQSSQWLPVSVVPATMLPVPVVIR